MKRNSLIGGTTFTEVNLRVLLKTAYKRKWLFILSMLFCMGMGWLYTHIIEPTYEVSSTMLVDIYKKSSLPESRIIGGHITPLLGKKNIYNELGGLKSYELVERTLKEMKANVTYHKNNAYMHREQYAYFPFVVTPIDTSEQLIDLPFKVKILSDTTYELSLEESKYKVVDPLTQHFREVDRAITFRDTFQFGDEIKEDYFHFIIQKPTYEIKEKDFAEWQLSFQIHSYRNLVAHYIDVLTIHLYDIESSIVHITTRGPVLPKEKDFHRYLAKNYIAFLAESRSRAASGRKAFIKEQMAIYRDSLDQAEQELESYKKEATVIDLAHTSTSALTEYERLETQSQQLNLDIRYYYSVLKYLSEQDGLGKIIAPSVVGVKDPLLNESLVELRKLVAERNRLEFTKGEESLELQQMDQRVEQIKTVLEENLRSLVDNTRLALAEKNNQIIRLDTTINKLPTKEKAFIRFKRKTNLYSNLYDYLSRELEKSGVAGSENMNDTQVLDSPRMVGEGPFWPQRLLIRIITFLLGVTLPIILLVLMESMDDVIKNVHGVEAFSDIPVLGSVARFKPPSKLFTRGNPHWQVEESFRNISAGLRFHLDDEDQKIIGMVSTVPGEGKTFCAINLAVSLAAGGKRVLLIDADFRKPGITDDVEKIKGRGFSDYLKGDIESVFEVVHLHKELPHLHYIPTRVEETNPQELLSERRISRMIQELRPQYDYIIFDTPAIGVVSDYLMIAAYMDVNLYVLRNNLSRYSFINDLEKLRRKGTMKNIYFILNDATEPSKIRKSHSPKTEAPSESKVRKYLLS